jgi:hypothetical protein
MSYARMDHAGWMLDVWDAHRRSNAARRARRHKPLYAEPPAEMTPFHAKVCDIIGITAGGIYNAPVSWNTADWNYGRGVSVVWRGHLATFDFNRLTALVFLCHEARIRCEIAPAGMYLRISFWPRRSERERGNGEFHPNLGEAVATFRDYVPPDHPTIYGDQVPTPKAARAA